ncbi:unnamed protein product [Miscanthus lutarioriparius]|uniref:Uncharacterized protein n=1 Tax=Miscanthus lutarioriparius TaxID=422564 RepID=A0A811PPS9_9POAL|nr:unnamed protein product [Miscanthus lutarioriparius]
MDVLLPSGHGQAIVGAASTDADADELAGLVSQHAWRAMARLWPDPEDVHVAWGVRSVLARFATDVTPDTEDARLVLARVGLATWQDSFEETTFLEVKLLEHLETSSDDNDNNLVLIISLMAFLLYRHVVLFDHIDDSSSKADTATTAVNRLSTPRFTLNLNLEVLQCLITLELMMDPITVATGQT